MKNNPLVSVIVPSYNSAQYLENSLKSIKAQTYKNIEIIVVDNYSVDNTKKIADNYNVKFKQEKAIRSKARNIAFETSKGEFIFSIDSDMELTPNVVKEAVEESKQYDALIIPEISFGEGFWAKCKALEKECYIGDDTIEASRFFKRSAFEKVNGYDPEMVAGEDWDIHQRIRDYGFKIGRIEAQIRHNEGCLSLWKTMKTKYNYGKTLYLYQKKHKTDAKKQFALIRPAFTRNWKRLAKNPLYATGMLFMKFCEGFATVLGIIRKRDSKHIF